MKGLHIKAYYTPFQRLMIGLHPPNVFMKVPCSVEIMLLKNLNLLLRKERLRSNYINRSSYKYIYNKYIRYIVQIIRWRIQKPIKHLNQLNPITKP